MNTSTMFAILLVFTITSASTCVTQQTFKCINDASGYWPKCDPSQSKSNAGPAGYEFGHYCTQDWVNAFNEMMSLPEVNLCGNKDELHKVLAQITYETGFFSTVYQPADGGAGLIHMIPNNWVINAGDMDSLWANQNYAGYARSMGKDFFQTPRFGWRSVAAWFLKTNRVIPACANVGSLFGKSYAQMTQCILGRYVDRSEVFNIVGRCLPASVPVNNDAVPTLPPAPITTTRSATQSPANGARCGSDWGNANGKCGTRCPSGTDAECTNGEKCYGSLSESPCATTSAPTTTSRLITTSSAQNNAATTRCGSDWGNANGKCGTPCPSGTDKECSGGEKCFASLSTSPCNGAQPTTTAGAQPTTTAGPAPTGDAVCITKEVLTCVNNKSTYWPKCDPSQSKSNGGPAGYEFGHYCTQEWVNAFNEMMSSSQVNKCQDRHVVHKTLAQIAYETGYFSTVYQPRDGGAGLIHMIPGNWAANAAQMDSIFGTGRQYQNAVASMGKNFFQTAQYGWKSVAAWFKRGNHVIPGCSDDLFEADYDRMTRCILSRVVDRSEAFRHVGDCLSAAPTTTASTSTTAAATTTATSTSTAAPTTTSSTTAAATTTTSTSTAAPTTTSSTTAAATTTASTSTAAPTNNGSCSQPKSDADCKANLQNWNFCKNGDGDWWKQQCRCTCIAEARAGCKDSRSDCAAQLAGWGAMCSNSWWKSVCQKTCGECN